MIKRVVSVLMSLFLGIPLFSQVNILVDSLPPPHKSFNPEWAFGASGGVTLSKIAFNPTLKQESLQQYTGGLTARYISEKNVGLQVELNYSMRGWDLATDTTSNQNPISTPNDTMRYTTSRSLGYLELPILTHIYFNMGQRMRVIFLLGPQLSYYLNEKSLDTEPVKNLSLTSISDSQYQKIQKSFDYGLLGGIGVELRTGIGSFVLDGRYYFGLSDIFNSTKADYFQASSNQVISFRLSYLFRK